MKDKETKQKENFVPMGVYKQIAWERNVEISQLESYGIGFGEDAKAKRIIEAEWLEDGDTIKCSYCGFEFSPKQPWFQDGVCVRQGDASFRPGFCSGCGAEMNIKEKKVMFEKNFMEACLDGSADLKQIEDYVEYWHTHNTGNELREFLGMTSEEYGEWAKSGNECLEKFLSERRNTK